MVICANTFVRNINVIICIYIKTMKLKTMIATIGLIVLVTLGGCSSTETTTEQVELNNTNTGLNSMIDVNDTEDVVINNTINMTDNNVAFGNITDVNVTLNNTN